MVSGLFHIVIKDFVEEAIEGVHSAEHRFQLVHGIGLEEEIVRERMPDGVEPRLDILWIGEILGEPLWHCLHGVFTDYGVEGFEVWCFYNAAEIINVADDCLAYVFQHRSRRTPRASCHKRVARFDVQIIAAAIAFAAMAADEGSEMALVG